MVVNVLGGQDTNPKGRRRARESINKWFPGN